jgi:hypothetical protein
MPSRYEVEFREEIGTAIPRLIALLNYRWPDIRPSTVSALTKLAGYGEFMPVCYLNITNL